MSSLPFLIAGGGIAGLAASLGLARIGRPARLFEQQPAFEEVGAGLQMSPNAVRALQWLDAWDAVAPACVAPSEILVRDSRSGRLLQRIRLGKPFETAFGAPYRVIHRADLLAGLVAAASARPTVELSAGCTVEQAATTADGAELDVAGVRVAGAAVIAADGIRSPIRQRLWPGAVPVYRGHAIHRALVPIAAVPGDTEADCVTLWLHPGGHVVHYPVSGWRQFNIVAAIDSGWTAVGWREPVKDSELRAAFGDVVEPLAKLLAAPREWLRWAGADLPPLAAWTAGNVALIGDAAHATLPYLAQGAAMALEDAYVLASCIARHRGTAEALVAYDGARRDRTARIQAASRRLATVYHARGVKAAARNAALRLLGPQQALSRYSWIYCWRPE